MFKHLTSRLLSSSSSRSLSSSLRLSLLRTPSLSSPSSSSLLLSPYRSFSNNTTTTTTTTNNNNSNNTPTTPFHPSASDLADNHNKWSEDKWEQEEKKAAYYLAQPDPHENNNLLLLGAFSAILLACIYQIGENINKYKREAKADDGEEDDEEGESKKNFIQKKWDQWNKPDQSILLPPEQPDMFGKRSRTVVVGLHDFLIHADWTRMDGWRTQKRPYYDDFLDRCIKSGWEIVLFSEKPSQEIDLLLQELDPQHKLKYRLASESLTHTGLLKLEKDISRLNRDPRRVIVLDYDDKYYSNSSLNLLKSIRFEGDIHDNTLLQLSELLEKINKYNIYDLREKITDYNDGIKLSDLFKKEEEEERLLMNNHNNNQYNNNNNQLSSSTTPSWLGGVISNAKKTGLRPGAKKVAENNE